MSENGNAAQSTGHALALIDAKAGNTCRITRGISPNNFIELRLGCGVVLYLSTWRHFSMVSRWLRRGYAVKISDGIIASTDPDNDALAIANLPTRGDA